ncbi:zinc finger Y-chromosomal protein-like isoform X2 [Choristoneura fumiferana]|uniref:zinc finger Y-chromosomal protein-like isoform X2 n=1 Tax=Choristoneura fumiferana TaxID=7141 RepID=UPI003D153BBF
MEDSVEMGPNQYCFGCLSGREENSVNRIILGNSALKTIFQTDKLLLCYLCKRALQQAEMFIQNVQNNQILLENQISLTESDMNLARTQIRSPYRLIRMILDSTDYKADESLVDEVSIVLNSNKDVKVKQEMKEESEGSEGEADDDNDYQDNYVKDEDFPLKDLLKKEMVVEEIDPKTLKRSLKKRKYKKHKKQTQEAHIIETIYITREQCLEERERQKLERRYVVSTYKCEDCVKGFNFKESYDKHLEKHSERNGEYQCEICKLRMSTEEKLISHKRYHEVRYRCPVCGLTRISRLTVKDHYSAFHTTNQHKHSCPHCSKCFKRQVSWRKHISNVHSHKRVTCGYCKKSYANKDVLKAHLIVQHPKEVSAGEITKSHVCQDCGMAFKAPSQLRIHSIKHSLSKDYYCVECDKSFKSASILKHHLKTTSTHVSYVELPLQCEHCDKRFAIRRDLDRHTNRVHLNIKPFQCDQCEKAYVNGWSLNEHRRLVHEGYKRPLKYPCPMCDKVFDRNQVLKGHIRTHTGERPYQCSRCPAQFSQASILGTHVRLIHLRLTRDGRPKPKPNK